MKLTFTKMHGAGNDFIVLDATQTPLSLRAEDYRRLADRRFGIGADQILIVEPSDRPDVDFRYRIINADGSEVEQCGNGSRAFVRYVREKGLTSKSSIRVITKAGVIEPRMETDGSITVDMGPPHLAAAAVPFDTQGLTARAEAQAEVWPLQLADTLVDVVVVSMGNPHAVQIVTDCDSAAVAAQGPQIEYHARFPLRVNAGFMQILDSHTVKLRVYERGAGETLACGTGACAAVVSGILRGRLSSPVQVQTRGGLLSIAWQGPGHSVMLSGPAVTVFEGEIEL